MPAFNFCALFFSARLLSLSLNKCSFAVNTGADPVILIIFFLFQHMKTFVAWDVWVCVWVFINMT